MAGNAAFTTQGATPGLSLQGLSSNYGISSSPQGKALNNVQQGLSLSGLKNTAGVSSIPTSTTQQAGSPLSLQGLNNNTGVSKPPSLTSGLLSQSPSTGLKKQTVQTPEGNTVTNEYHAPQTASNSTDQASQSSNNINPVGSLGYDLANGLAAGTSSKAGYHDPNATNYSGLVSSLANQQDNPYNQSAQGYINQLGNTSTSGNDALGKKAQDIGDTLGSKIASIETQGQGGQTAQLTSSELDPTAQGRAAVVYNNMTGRVNALNAEAQNQLAGNSQAIATQGQKQSGLTSASGQSLTGQGQSQAATGAAAGYAQPSGNTAFFGNPLTGGLYGQGNNLVNQGVQNAISFAKGNGADPAVIRSQLLSQYGAPAAQAFDNAMLNNNSGYNPTVASATSQQNASQAVQYQQKATDLDTSLKNLDNVSSTAVNFLNSSGLLNQTSNPHYNQGINSYIANVSNPGAAATYATVIGDLNNFKSQILSQNTGQTPTALTNYVESTDPSNLSAPQLADYLKSVQALGQQQLSTYQQQSKSSGGGGYAGAPAGVNTNLTVSPNANLDITGDQAGQAAIGTGINLAGGIQGILKSVIGKAASYF